MSKDVGTRGPTGPTMDSWHLLPQWILGTYLCCYWWVDNWHQILYTCTHTHARACTHTQTYTVDSQYEYSIGITKGCNNGEGNYKFHNVLPHLSIKWLWKQNWSHKWSFGSWKALEKNMYNVHVSFTAPVKPTNNTCANDTNETLNLANTNQWNFNKTVYPNTKHTCVLNQRR